MYSLRAISRLAARKPLNLTASSKSLARCMATSPLGQFKPTAGFIKFSESLEHDIRQRLDALPSAGKIFQNPDGTARNPEDSELKEVAALSILANEKRLATMDIIRLNGDQIELYVDNQNDLREYLSNGKKILDKIPVEDPNTGEITWSIIRAEEKEGWENIIYYGFIPALLIALGFALFLDKEDISEWALEELRLRAQEKYDDNRQDFAKDNNISAEDIKKRDELIVERILSGEYDRLAGLKKAGSELPSSLI